MSEKETKLTGAEDVSWDLTDLYAGVDDPAIEADMNRTDELAGKLATEYKGRIADLDAEEMLHGLPDLVLVGLGRNLEVVLVVQLPHHGALLGDQGAADDFAQVLHDPNTSSAPARAFSVNTRLSAHRMV